jgi:hypothetical protein
MIYSMYFEMIRRESEHVAPWYARAEGVMYEELCKLAGKRVNISAMTAKVIKESEDDSFVFIITNPQMLEFNTWLSKYELEEYVVFRQERPITNSGHDYNGRNLNLIVLASKQHAWREMFETEEEELV